MRVLIIDNDAKQRKMISESLIEEGYEIFAFGNGKKGLKSLQAEKISILIAAFDMPKFGGKELVDGILASKVDPSPFIVFLVNEGSQQAAVDCLGAILGDYMISPISSDGLRARIAVVKRSIKIRDRLDAVSKDSESLALYDQLTGVFNRQAVYDQALAEISRSQREGLHLSIAMIEICDLQEIEEEHGIKIRNQALRYVSSAVRANVRIYDILGRWIGAKFMLMLPNTNLEDVSTVVERVNQSISTIGIQLPDRSRLEIQVNVGVSSLPRAETIPLYMLVEQANSALLKASNEVETQVVYFEG